MQERSKIFILFKKAAFANRSLGSPEAPTLTALSFIPEHAECYQATRELSLAFNWDLFSIIVHETVFQPLLACQMLRFPPCNSFDNSARHCRLGSGFILPGAHQRLNFRVMIGRLSVVRYISHRAISGHHQSFRSAIKVEKGAEGNGSKHN